MSDKAFNAGGRRGFTLVELLVVIAIIGLLVGLLLPAVQAARSASRRIQCANHLRSLATSLWTYESAMRRFPPGYASQSLRQAPHPDRDPGTWDAPPGWGWGAHLLPFLDEAPLRDRLDLGQPVWQMAHRPFVSQNLDGFLCPSASRGRDPFVAVDAQQRPLSLAGGPLTLGRSHYVASHGQESCWGECGGDLSTLVFEDIYAGRTRTVQHNGDVSLVADGPFYRNSRTRVKDVLDGMSQTIFLGEHSGRLSEKTWVGVVPGAFTHPGLLTPENGPDAAATLVLAHAGPSGGELDITGFPIIHPVNYPTYHVGQMYSEHPGGGNVAMGDGSVRFVVNEVDLIVWAEYSSMAEREVPRESL